MVRIVAVDESERMDESYSKTKTNEGVPKRALNRINERRQRRGMSDPALLSAKESAPDYRTRRPLSRKEGEVGRGGRVGLRHRCDIS